MPPCQREAGFTYDGDGLDTEHEGIRRQVSRVRQGILLPQLREEILGACNIFMLVDKIALKIKSIVSGALSQPSSSVGFACRGNECPYVHSEPPTLEEAVK